MTVSGFTRKVNHRFHIMRLPHERLNPAIEWNPSCDESLQPTPIRTHERVGRGFIMAPIRIHRAEDNVVFQNQLSIERVHIDG